MSRIARNSIFIPQGVKVSLAPSLVTVQGSLGELATAIPSCLKIDATDQGLAVFVPGEKTQDARSQLGTYYRLISNMIKGVHEGFFQQLEMHGVGYRAALDGRVLKLSLGYSHDIFYPLPEGISAKIDKQNLVLIGGRDKQLVGQTCAEICRFRPPEPYKGKGIRRSGSFVVRKEGKKK